MKVLYHCPVVFSILVCLVVCVSAQSTISLVQVSPPTGNSYAPVPVTNTVNQYDIPAGSNLTVACGESETSLRYPTNQFAQFDRFGLGTRGRVSTYYDTGVIECYNTADSNNASLTYSVYIFVYDPNEPLYVPLNTSGSTGGLSVTVKKDEYVPCLPTHSSITFTLSLRSGPVLPTVATQDNTQGFKLLRSPPPLPLYTCSFTYAAVGRTDIVTIHVTIAVPPQIMVSYVYESETVSVMSNPHTTYFQLYKEVELDCTVTEGFPSPQLSWMWQPCDNTKPDCIVDEVAWQTLPTTLSPSTTTFDNSPYFTSSSSSSQSILINTERSGWYQCSAENGIDSPAMYRIFTVVSALPPSSKGIGFSTQTVQTASQLVVGDNFYMHCHVARFECSASQVAITGSGGVRYTQGQAGTFWIANGNSYILFVTLKNVTRNMTGNRYFCGCNSKTSDVMLTVLELISPFWAQHVESKPNMTVGDTETFTCQAGGQPLPKVTWFKDNKRILNDSTTVVLGRNNHSLTIYKATLEDSGSYSCVGMTRRSPPIYSNFTLTVTARTAKLKNVRIVMIAVLVPAVIFIVIATIVCVIRQRRQTREEVPLERLSTNKNL
ncbi:FLT1 [Bugula neritina]|uniref:FLT1 n=1 Tax=Bugula neritina TaxID=10212 RepID=A0A7J7ISD2_BUGNE|nr:FLT1 [Bugula neritina]